MQHSTRISADHLVARLLTVPREERALVLAQEGPRAWDSVLFFAVRDGLRGARFGGRLSAADYLETLQQVERHFEQGSEHSIPRGPPANEDSDEHTVDLIPEAANDAADSAQAAAPQPDPTRETREPGPSGGAGLASATPREPVTALRPTPETEGAGRGPGAAAANATPRVLVTAPLPTPETAAANRGVDAGPASAIPREPAQRAPANSRACSRKPER